MKESAKDFKEVASPERPEELAKELSDCQLLGETQDNKRIFLYQYRNNSSLMKEIGRLREESFRLVGEGTGLERDIDEYDQYYDHIILWDDDALELVGAYRLKGCDQLDYQIDNGLLRFDSPLYTSSLFKFKEGASRILEEGLELGRSFVQAKYWGSKSLEYLWYGIAAYLREHPQYKYLFGAVSISNTLSPPAKNLLIHYYKRFYGPSEEFRKQTISCRTPFELNQSHLLQLDELFTDQDKKQSFLTLKKQMRYLGYAVPVLYKQYAELTEGRGTQFLGFNIDPNFNDCIDGFVVVDIDKMTPQKRKRYQLVDHRQQKGKNLN